MTWSARAVLVSGLLFACAGRSRLPAATGESAPVAQRLSAPPTVKTGHTFRSPREILELMEKSTISYQLIRVEEVVPTNLSAPNLERRLHPHYALRQSGGAVSLVVDDPPAAAASLFARANDAATRKEHDEALRLYDDAVRAAPGYFKSHTYVGNGFFVLGDLTNAERSFRQAIELNPIDYQAHWFLGHTLARAGRLDEAIEPLTQAYVLYRNHDSVESLLSEVLKKKGLGLRADRLLIPARLEVVSDEEVRLFFAKPEGLQWTGVLTCLAVWEAEPTDQEREEAAAMDPVNQLMYRECLVNQASTTDHMIQAGEPVSPAARALRDAILGGYLAEVIYWELLAPKFPEIVLLLPEDGRRRIGDYIREHVIVALEPP